MCNKLQTLISNIEIKNGQTKKIYSAVADDIDKVFTKIVMLENNIKSVAGEILSVKNAITFLSTKLTKIERKLYDDKIEEKAYVFETLNILARNKWFWIIAIAIIMLAGTGVLTLLEKSHNIQEITNAIKKV